jgi:hypothetical protein
MSGETFSIIRLADTSTFHIEKHQKNRFTRLCLPESGLVQIGLGYDT